MDNDDPEFLVFSFGTRKWTDEEFRAVHDACPFGCGHPAGDHADDNGELGKHPDYPGAIYCYSCERVCLPAVEAVRDNNERLR